MIRFTMISFCVLRGVVVVGDMATQIQVHLNLSLKRFTELKFSGKAQKTYCCMCNRHHLKMYKADYLFQQHTQAKYFSIGDHAGCQSLIIVLLKLHQNPDDLTKDVSIIK